VSRALVVGAFETLGVILVVVQSSSVIRLMSEADADMVSVVTLVAAVKVNYAVSYRVTINSQAVVGFALAAMGVLA
jgi:hypothetical protein